MSFNNFKRSLLSTLSLVADSSLVAMDCTWRGDVVRKNSKMFISSSSSSDADTTVVSSQLSLQGTELLLALRFEWEAFGVVSAEVAKSS
jgi:hypothetical protein